MLEMKNCTDIEKYSEYIPKDSVSPMVLESIDGESASGFIVYEYVSDSVLIYAVCYHNDLALCDGLIRAAMFKAYLKGLKTAKLLLSDARACADCKKLKFITNDSNDVEIESILGGCAECQKK